MKYMLLRVTNGVGQSKLVVRGDQRAEYHRNIIEHTERELHQHSVQVSVVLCTACRIPCLTLVFHTINCRSEQRNMRA